MVKLTLIARLLDALPLAEGAQPPRCPAGTRSEDLAGLETEKSESLEEYKAQAKARPSSGLFLARSNALRAC